MCQLISTRISIVVPAYNAAGRLGACLQALSDQTIPPHEYEVIVVDDGSQDATGDVARAFDVQVIRQDNAGPAAARNRGARNASGDILLFTDSDCVPQRDWIEKMIERLHDPEVAGVKGVYLTRQRGLAPRFAQAEYEDKYDNMKKVRYIDFIDTYSAGYRRDVFFDNGGFDTGLPAVEDIDLSLRLSRKGHKLVLAPDAVVYHSHPPTLPRYLYRKYRLGQWYARVYVRFPGKMFKDSYTPRSVRLQIGFSALLGLALVLSAFRFISLLFALPLAVGLVLSALPLSARNFGRDRPVALMAPLVVFLRSLAQLSGLLVGGVAMMAGPQGRSQVMGRLLRRKVTDEPG